MLPAAERDGSTTRRCSSPRPTATERARHNPERSGDYRTPIRRIFEVPSPLPDAFGFIDATVGQPNHIGPGPGPRHLVLLRALCDEADAVGDLVPDAVVAAVAAEHAAEVVTLDRDLARFSSVRHRRPDPAS